MTLKLHVFPPSPRAFKVLAVAKHLQLEYELCLVDFAKGVHKSPGYTALNPNQRMPTLEEDGFVLWESNAITQYLASKRPESGLLPDNPRDRARVLQWQCWDLAHWEQAIVPIIFERFVKKLFRGAPEDPAEVAKGLEKFAVFAPVLDQALSTHRYVAGDTLTVADFSLGSTLNLAPAVQLPLEPYPNIRRWHGALKQLPAWHAAWAEPPT